MNKEIILEAIQEVQAQGIKIIPGAWGVRFEASVNKWILYDDYCSALGAVLLIFQPNPSEITNHAHHNSEKIAELFKCSIEDVESFIDCFDQENENPENESGKIGKELRELILEVA